jgi:2-keto-4-pentenoate hydratase/2-oxohepta-3-ene-1,7-dioic acid hydratase in catechol pathway
MRLCSYLDGGLGERLAVVDEELGLPARELLPDGPATMQELMAGGVDSLSAIRAAVDQERIRRDGRPLAAMDLLAPVPRPGKIVAIGRNYREHAAEEGAEPPTAPLIFAKFATSVVGPGADVRWDPALTSQVDYEAELAVIVGRRTRGVTPEHALEFIFGYTCLNDVSARDLQFGDGQWTRGKSLDTFCPMGPVLVTADEIADPQALSVAMRINGEVRQSSHTSKMIFPVDECISVLSQGFTILPGDVIATGTPEGVGAALGKFLKAGDKMEAEVERIGILANRIAKPA